LGGPKTGGGRIALAQQYRLALLLPEQSSENNRARCFNWFRPHDVKRGSGEAMSIRQMIRRAVKQFGSDPRQVFVVGFRPAVALAAALLAAYPSVFAAGGVFAGMPVGCARTPITALARMRRADSAGRGRPSRPMCAEARGRASPGRAWRSGKGNATRPSIRERGGARCAVE